MLQAQSQKGTPEFGVVSASDSNDDALMQDVLLDEDLFSPEHVLEPYGMELDDYASEDEAPKQKRKRNKPISTDNSSMNATSVPSPNSAEAGPSEAEPYEASVINNSEPKHTSGNNIDEDSEDELARARARNPHLASMLDQLAAGNSERVNGGMAIAAVVTGTKNS